jgi:hypothetical protein
VIHTAMTSFYVIASGVLIFRGRYPSVQSLIIVMRKPVSIQELGWSSGMILA